MMSRLSDAASRSGMLKSRYLRDAAFSTQARISRFLIAPPAMPTSQKLRSGWDNCQAHRKLQAKRDLEHGVPKNGCATLSSSLTFYRTGEADELSAERERLAVGRIGEA